MTYTPDVAAVIQARTGSTRLPGKVMFPLDGHPVLTHVIKRVSAADRVDETIVATSDERPDDVIKQVATQAGVGVFRGSEDDVLSRFEGVAEQYNPDLIVRVTADCPLISPQFIDTCVNCFEDDPPDYVSAGPERTFPRGVTCEAFTQKSFEQVIEAATEPQHREHVTPYYRNNPQNFRLYNIKSQEVFETDWLQNRTDLRLTLDEPDDYQLLKKVYRQIAYDDLLSTRDAIRYIDENGLAEINQNVVQKTV